MQRVILVEPADLTIGKSLITPGWLPVLAKATPQELVDGLILVDEAIKPFDPSMVHPGDIVGISLKTHNCLAGYRVAHQAKLHGATVIMGGPHATIRPHEALTHGADVVIKHDGELAWPKVLHDIPLGLLHLNRIYDGDKIPGEKMLSGDWNLIDPKNYLLCCVRSVTGCTENCSFCSEWKDGGRKQRMRSALSVTEEVKQLLKKGFPAILFADDNFFAAPLGRIARAEAELRKAQAAGKNPHELQRISNFIEYLKQLRAARLKFLREYTAEFGGHPPAGFVQMTSEVASDTECLSAMCQAGIRVGLVGFESPDPANLAASGKSWNPSSKKEIAEIVRDIQSYGILVFGSFISGLTSDTSETVGKIGEFAAGTGMFLAQFTTYCPLPGTLDYQHMIAKPDNLEAVQLTEPDFWLDPEKPRVVIKHPHLKTEELMLGGQKNWADFYGVSTSFARSAAIKRWTIKIAYILGCQGFKKLVVRKGTDLRPKKPRRIWPARFFLDLAIRLSHRHT